jgi:hypothetical protein
MHALAGPGLIPQAVSKVRGRSLARLMQIAARGHAGLCGDAHSKGGDYRGSGANFQERMVVVWIGRNARRERRAEPDGLRLGEPDKEAVMSSRTLGWVVLGIACCAILVVIGCENETTAPERDQEDFANPYDWVGEMHNKGLDYTLDRIAQDPRADWDVGAVEAVVLEFAESEPDGRVLLTAGTSDMALDQIAGIIAWTTDGYYAYIETLHGEGKVSQGFADYATEILDLCLRGSNQGLREIAADINDSSLEQGEKVILLAAASIADHSSRYWSAWPATDTLCDAQLIHPIAAADIVGGVCGGVSSWLTTRYTGHSDWTDIVGGALIGAVGASTLGYVKVG